MPSKKPTTIEEYIGLAPKESQARLRQIHEAMREVAPAAKEVLKWGMPAYQYQRILVQFAHFKNHIGFFPTPPVIKKFARELAKYKTSAASIQFPMDKPLPLSLIKKIAKFRVKESLERDAKWRSDKADR